jgi:hypothetical protein
MKSLIFLSNLLGGFMKPELNLRKVKDELIKLTDVDYLKKELARLTTEIKNYDLEAHLTPQANMRLKKLEKRFQEIRKSVIRAEKQIGSEVNKLLVILRKASAETQAKVKAMGMGQNKSKTRKKTIKKASKKAV